MAARLRFLGGPAHEKEIEINSFLPMYFHPFMDRGPCALHKTGHWSTKIAVYKFVDLTTDGYSLMMYVGLRGY